MGIRGKERALALSLARDEWETETAQLLAAEGVQLPVASPGTPSSRRAASTAASGRSARSASRSAAESSTAASSSAGTSTWRAVRPCHVAAPKRSSPGTRDASLSSLAKPSTLTKPGYYFSSDDEDSRALLASEDADTSGEDSVHNCAHYDLSPDSNEPSQGSSEQDYDSDLEELDAGDLDEKALCDKLGELERRKLVLDREFNDAIQDLPEDNKNEQERLKKEYRERRWNLQHRYTLTTSNLELERSRKALLRAAQGNTAEDEPLMVNFLKVVTVVVLAVFSKFAIDVFHYFQESYLLEEEHY